MLEIKAKNEQGEVLAFGRDSRYAVTISGVSPAAATINLSKAAMIDGARFNSSRVSERNIVLMVYFLKDVESARLNLYRLFTCIGVDRDLIPFFHFHAQTYDLPGFFIVNPWIHNPSG